MYAVESIGLTKHYSRGKIKALTGFDLKLEKGRIFSLLGPNGAGKTTLMKILLSIALPTSGEGFILGKNIKHSESRMKIGYLSENHRFPGFLDTEQFLYYYGKMSDVPGPVLKERIPELIKLVRLEDKKNLKLKKFSKGMLQRAGTAQALINDPEIIFLDEPTDGIDPVGRIEIREILLKLKDQGKTIFINSHLLSEVERMSDEIAILKKGSLIRKGNTSDFLESTGRYKISVAKGSEKILYGILESKDVSFTPEADYVLSEITDEIKLNEIIDLLRGEKIIITGVEQLKSTLEDYFIKVIR